MMEGIWIIDMKLSFIETDKFGQLILTPETDWEKEVLDRINQESIVLKPVIRKGMYDTGGSAMGISIYEAEKFLEIQRDLKSIMLHFTKKPHDRQAT